MGTSILSVVNFVGLTLKCRTLNLWELLYSEKY